MKLVKFLETWFHVPAGGASVAQFEAGKFYPLSDETAAHVARGIAEEFEAPDEPTKAESAAFKAQAAAARAAAAATEARELANAALEAQRIADAMATQQAADAQSQRLADEAVAVEAQQPVIPPSE